MICRLVNKYSQLIFVTHKDLIVIINEQVSQSSTDFGTNDSNIKSFSARFFRKIWISFNTILSSWVKIDHAGLRM
jgi:hypothetical protein